MNLIVMYGHRKTIDYGKEKKKDTGNIMSIIKTTEESVNSCFEPSKPLRIISGLMEAFIKRYIVERTNKTEIKPEEQNGEMLGEIME